MKNVKSPKPFFDTMEEMPNPFKSPVLDINSITTAEPKGALSDYQHASEFIYSYRGSPDTFATYRREIEHFLHWSWLIAEKSIKDLLRQDLEAYVEFTKSPPPAWIGKKNVARFVNRLGERSPNAAWRPYVSSSGEYAPSQAAIQSLFSVLSSFYNFLIQESYVSANPVSQMRQKSKYLRKHQSQGKIRRLSPLQWDYVIETADFLAKDDPKTHERTLFVLTALFGMYLRISELVETPRWQPQMGHFQMDQEENWWFVTVGKGNKEREVSVSDAMLHALKRYRNSRGLPPLPSPGESTPLIHKTRGKGGITSTRQIRGIVQHCFTRAAQKMKNEGFPEDADRLEAATVHWLRHTGISEDVKIRPREHVRDDAGHGSSAITDRYIDVERAERHATAKLKTVR